jgi:hypothetical protein
MYSPVRSGPACEKAYEMYVWEVRERIFQADPQATVWVSTDAPSTTSRLTAFETRLDWVKRVALIRAEVTKGS